MPVEIIAHNPRVMRLPAAGLGILTRIILHFWLTECQPLPIDRDELFSVARAHRPTWSVWRDEILSIFNDIAPALTKAHRSYTQRQEALTALGVKGSSVISLRAAERRAARFKASHAPTAPIVSSANRTPKSAANRDRQSGFRES